MRLLVCIEFRRDEGDSDSILGAHAKEVRVYNKHVPLKHVFTLPNFDAVDPHRRYRIQSIANQDDLIYSQKSVVQLERN